MKNIFIVIALLFIFLTGCSSTYKVTDFPSKEKFYEEFNNSFKEREAKVTLVNDSSFFVRSGVEINHDTLLSFEKLEEKIHRRFALSDVADIGFSGSTTTSASVVLKDGDKLTGAEVKVTKDSISFVGVKSLITSNTVAQIDKVKTVTFKNRWYGLRLWAITGALTGGCIGLLNVKSFSTSHWESQELMYFPIGAGVGFIIGAIGGYFFGYPITYEFNK